MGHITEHDYEIERGKPMPNLTHGSIQANLIFELKSAYPNAWRVASEVALDTKPIGSTPDVVLYPPLALDFINEPAKRTDAPLLAVEIQSSTQTMDEMVEKINRYFEFGVKSCWIVVPSLQAILVYESPENYHFFHNGDTLQDPTLNIKLSLPALFS